MREVRGIGNLSDDGYGGMGDTPVLPLPLALLQPARHTAQCSTLETSATYHFGSQLTFS